MAVSATTVWEVRTTGNDTNGGGFDSATSGAGTDYSQQDAAQLSLTDLAADQSSTTVTSVTGGFTAAMIGNYLQIASGTNFIAGFYRITARTDTNTITVDTAPATAGAGSSGVGSIGGALATPGKAGGAHAGGNVIWVKNGTYDCSTTNNVAGGRITPVAGPAQATPTILRGYTSTRGDWSTRPILRPGANSVIVITGSNNFIVIANLELQSNSKTSCTGISATGSGVTVYLCKVSGGFATGIQNSGSNSSKTVFCEVTGCTTYAILHHAAVACYSHDNSCHGFDSSSYGGYCVFCTSDTNTGTTKHGFRAATYAGTYYNCTSYNNSGSGFYWSSNYSYASAINCHAEGHTGGYGFECAAAQEVVLMLNCSAYNNASGATLNPSALFNLGAVTVTDGSPLTAPADGDFRLNATALRGALLRAAGIPGELPGLGSTNRGYIDIGALQHADPAGGSGGGFPILGGSVVR